MSFLGRGTLSITRLTLTWGALAGVFLGEPPHAYAESTASLEDQILSGTLPSTPTNDTSADAGNDEDLIVPTSAEEKQKASEEKEKVESELEEIDEKLVGPDQVPLDHILVVQYRFIRKEGLHEITPIFIGGQPADSFRQQLTWGFSYAYHFTEDFGVEALHAAFMKNYNTGLSTTIQTQTQPSGGLITDRKEPVFSLGSSLVWTPLKSKAATYTDIHYFEGYFLGGGGMNRYEHMLGGMAMWGVGFRAYMTQRSLFKVEIRDYMDFYDGTNHRMNILVGATVLLGEEAKTR